MGRHKLSPLYVDEIKKLTWRGLTAYAITKALRETFTQKEIEVTGQKLPVESTVQKYRKQAELERETEVPPGNIEGIDQPWMTTRGKDIDGISEKVSDFIATKILPNRFIMEHRALNYPTFTDHFDAVTRRTAMWIQKLFERLRGEDPLLIWSIAWMYSGDEMRGENPNIDYVFDTRPLDYYVARRPWVSEENHRKYMQKVVAGNTEDLKRNSMFFTLHLLQISSLNHPPESEQLTEAQIIELGLDAPTKGDKK